MYLLKVNGTILPTPLDDGYTVSRQDLDSSTTGRAEDGIMYRDRVRAGVYKVECKWMLTMEDLSSVVSTIAGDSFTLEFFDLTTCKYVSGTFYAGDRSASIVNYIDEADTGKAMCELSCNFIEF